MKKKEWEREENCGSPAVTGTVGLRGFRSRSPKRMSYMKNGSYYDTDTGIQPDCIIVKPEHFYDREALTDYINRLF